MASTQAFRQTTQMTEVSIFLIAVGLAMDAFAVSVASGVTIQRMRLRHAMVIASFFGAFQAIMPVVGWLLGQAAREAIAAWDHWLAFLLLTGVGVKMIYEASKEQEVEEVRDPMRIYVLFLLAIATSIDALAVGVTFSFLDVAVLHPVLAIGGVTFCMCFAGTYIGDHFGHLFEQKLEVLAGVILIGIGLKILLEQLFAA